MKYENLDQATRLCAQIKRDSNDLENLNGYRVTIEINTAAGRLCLIGCDSGSEHQWYPQAKIMIEALKADLQHRIEKAKTELAEL